MSPLLVRERAPLKLHATIKPPTGPNYRWGSDEWKPQNIPSNLTFSTTMPGGFENCSMVLPRRTEIAYQDLQEFETIAIRGAGGQIAWEGRLERTPRSSGDQLAISPGAVGWQSHLDDNKSARMIFVDIEQTHWTSPSVQRQLDYLAVSADAEGGSTSTDPTSGQPSLATAFAFPIARYHVSEAWYDAQNLIVSSLYYAWKINSIINSADANYVWTANLSSDDRATVFDTTGTLRAAGPGAGTLNAPYGGVRRFACVEMHYAAAVAGFAGESPTTYWTCLAVYGNHGLATQGVGDFTSAPGLLASDIVGYAIRTWASKLATSWAGVSTITPTTFAIPHLAYLEPTTAGQIVKDATRFELWDWAVWDGPTFWYHPRGARGKSWRARVGPSGLQEAGPQVDRIWNGVIVTYQDVSGVSRTVGPPGSGANATDASLADSDPANPANAAGLTRWIPLSMNGTGTLGSAAKIGQTFLQIQKQLNTSGEASLNGHVLDDKGVLWPTWMVRAGDTISFVDAADTSLRRIVRTEYSDATKTNQISLDSPPDGLQALLERMSVAITPLGLS